MRGFTLLLIFASLLSGCAGTSKALVAVQDERITLKAAEADVVAAAGPPELILARSGVETFYYKHGDNAVSVSLLNGNVIAFNDNDGWPEPAFDAALDADNPVSLGSVRIGMTEPELRTALGEPSGLTAKKSEETLHWLTDDDVDSAVAIKDGVVVGYWDRPISEYTQNIPTHDRENSTTNGQIRVGMTDTEVKQLLGEPDGKSGKEGIIAHRYESDPLFGDTIYYGVGYKDGKVVELTQFNPDLDEEMKEEEESKKAAAAATAKSDEAESSIFGFLSNPLVQAAIGTAIANAAGGKKINHTKKVEKKTVTSHRTITINGRTWKGPPPLGNPCSLDGRACPGGYSCLLQTSNSGMCVPSN